MTSDFPYHCNIGPTRILTFDNLVIITLEKYVQHFTVFISFFEKLLIF